jgi:prepilin-type N-terminal cleavage/methylation domain-containing protein/prepilin-type processing-associated H-X9-DG protein
MKSSSLRHVRRAFTLIELLVVIAIIAILAAILFPVFAQAKAAAKKTSCLSQTKQIAVGTLLYCGDYDDYEPLLQWGGPPEFISSSTGPAPTMVFTFWFGGVGLDFNNPGAGWKIVPQKGMLYPYMKNQAIMSCPSATVPRNLDGGLQHAFNLGYGINYNVIGAGADLGGHGSATTTGMDAPADTILFSDSATATDNPSLGLEPSFVLQPPSGGGSPTMYGVHTQKCNVAWSDGHSKSTSLSKRPANYYSNTAVQNLCETNSMGDVMNSRYPYGSDWQDFYFRTDKPN